MVKFEYKKELDRNGEAVYRPIADVWFKSSTNNWVELHPYIDSGADITLVPYSFGKLLGFRKIFAPREKIGGIGGKMDVICVKSEIKIGDKIIKATIGWAQSENVPALLGRSEIFDEFEVSFKQREKQILFS